jgi:hypothetical protein
MMKRITWFAAGLAAGAAGAGYAKNKVRRTAAQLAPVQVVRQAGNAVRRTGHDVADAVREGRAAMRHREDELRARRDGRLASIEDRLAPGDELLVDGRPVERERVVVLRRVK